jgi:hypothetical protein
VPGAVRIESVVEKKPPVLEPSLHSSQEAMTIDRTFASFWSCEFQRRGYRRRFHVRKPGKLPESGGG